MMSSYKRTSKLGSSSAPSAMENLRPNSLHDSWLQSTRTMPLKPTNPMMKHKARRKPNALLGAKLQPLLKDASVSNIHSRSTSTESYGVLPQISHTQSAHAILCGNLTDDPVSQPDCVRIYLCYNHEDMKAECDWLLKTAVPQLKQFCDEHNLALQFIDANWHHNRQQLQPSLRLSSSTKVRQTIIADCKSKTLGPNFVLLLGNSCGRPLIPSEINENQFKALQQVFSEQRIEGGDQLLSMYSKNDDVKPGFYLLQANIEAEKLDELSGVLQAASSHLSHQLTEDDFKNLYQTALEEEVAHGILRRSDARTSCLCYRRESQTTATSSGSSSGSANQNTTTGLWETVCRYLGTGNWKSYIAAGMADGDSATDDTYLGKLSADFVADVKVLIERSVAKVGQDRRKLEHAVVQELKHHASLQSTKLARVSSYDVHENLLKRVREFVRDPHQSSRPFVVHGIEGAGKSTAMAAIGAALCNWFPFEGAVVATRFLGTSTDTADVHGTVASIARQVRLAYGAPAPSASVVASCDSLHGELTAFRVLLEGISRSHAHTKPLFILLDGIDLLQPWHDALEVLWAVRRLPPNVYLLMSTTGSGKGSGGGPQSIDSGPDILGAMLALVTDIELTYEVTHDSTVDGKSDSSIAGVAGLLQILESLEMEFGRNVVTLFCAYLSIVHVGITDSELSDLLSTSTDVATDLGISLGSHFASALVAELRHRLDGYLEDRLVHGLYGFGWSQIRFRKAVANRYGFIVTDGGGAGSGGADLSAESTHLTLMLHESVANLHLKHQSDRSSLFMEDQLKSDDSWSSCSTVANLTVGNPLTLSRLPYHMRVLLPLEGLARMNNCLLFNYQWLSSRLASAPINVVLNDVFSTYKLAGDMHKLSLSDEPAQEDLAALYEFLQLARKSICANPRNLAVEIVTRLESLESISLFGNLVRDAKQWIADQSNFASFVPLWPVWRRPGGTLRHCMSGPTRTIGFVDGGEIAVTYGEKSGIGVWRLQTGAMLHQFSVRSEQPVSGIVSANDSTFVVTLFYSHIEKNTELCVLSTESGLQLLTMKFPVEIETLALSDDDQLVTLSSVDLSGSDGSAKKRTVIGVRVMSKEVEFRLPIDDVHADGIAKILFVKNIRRDSQSIVTLGNKSSRDLAFWDLSTSSLDYVLDLGCGVDHIRLAVEHKIAVCLSSDTGTLIIANLSRGSIEQKLHDDVYHGALDVVLHDENIFVATRTGSVVILSMTQYDVVGNFVGGGQSIPSKLAAGSFRDMALLFVGYEDGDIRVFDIGAEAAVGSLSGGHRRQINSLSVLPDGRLVSSGDDHRAILWNYESCLELGENESRDHRSRDRREDADEREEVDRNVQDDIQDIGCFTFGNDEKQIISGSQSGVISVWDVSSGDLIKQLGRGGSKVSVDRVYIALKGQVLVAHRCSEDASSRDVRHLEVWDLEKGEMVNFENTDPLVYCSEVLPTDCHLLTIGPSFDIATPGFTVAIHSLNPLQTLTSMNCNIYGKMDASCLRVIGFSRMPSKRPLPAARRPPSGKAFIPSATKRIAAGGLPGAPRSTRKNVRTGGNPSDSLSTAGVMEGLHAVVNYFPQSSVSYFFAFSIDGRLDSLSMERNDPMHLDTVGPECCVVLPLGGACICGTTAGTLVQWSTRSRSSEVHFVDAGVKPSTAKSGTVGKLAHSGPVTCLAIDDVSQLLLSGGRDGKVKVWSVVSKELLISLSGHEGSVTCLHFTPQMGFMSAAEDGTLRVWEKTTSAVARSVAYRKRCVFHLHGHASSIAMTTDRQRVAATVRTEPVDRSVLFLLRSMNI